jgi:hypothetical protein
MTNEVAVRDVDSWAPMLPAVGDLASKISSTSFVPKSLRGKPAETAACILAGREIGIGPMESLQKIHVVDGRPTMSAELMRSLVLRAGHEIRFATLTDDTVVAEGRRAGTDTWTSVKWTIKDATRIGLASKQVWKQYPRQMLSARATSELCRLLFPDALGGISFTPEEIDDDQPASKPAAVTIVRESKPAAVAAAQPDPEPTPLDVEPEPEPEPEVVDVETGEIVDAEVVEEQETPTITEAQMRKMRVLLGNVGMKDRTVILDYVRGVVGRQVESSKGLTKAEASTVIEALTELEALTTTPEPPLDDQ